MSTKTSAVIKRLYKIFDVSSDTNLSKSLNVGGKSTISSWRTRDSIPYSLCVDIAEEFDVSLDWLLTGKGEMYRRELNEHEKHEKRIQEEMNTVIGITTPSVILNRMCLILNVQGDEDLGKEIGELTETIKKWRKQGSVPYEACEKVADQEKVSLSWIINGFGDMHNTDTMDRRMYIMSQLMEALPDQQQQEILAAIKEKERINDLERKIAALTNK